MKIRYFNIILLSLIFYLLSISNAFAMHISEGILPFKWAGLWTLIALPFLIKGILDIKKRLNETPSFKPLLGLMCAVVFIISCMPIPVPTAGTCSHPCGTGISAILLGPIMSIFISSIALLLQALFLAHGGLTTWGANIVSMGIAGSFAGYFAFKILRRFNIPLFISGFVAGLLADWLTYITTSFELASALAKTKPVFQLFMTILIAFIPTQLPLGILEGFLTGGMIVFVAKRRPDILVSFGVIKKTAGILLIALLLLAHSHCVYAQGNTEWSGVDETVIERIAQEHGRTALRPLINTDQGDLLLFAFLSAGVVGGFALGYIYRRIFVERDDLKGVSRDIL